MIRKVHPSPIAFDRTRKILIYDIVGDKLAVATSTTMSALRVVESSPILITDVTLVVNTVSTGACTIDIGTTVTSASTESDNIFDGIDVASGGTTIAVMRNDALDSAANVNVKELAVGGFVTVKEKTGAAEGLLARLYIEYMVK